MTPAPFAALCPGQLSEKAGLGEAFAARFEFVAAWFEEVSRRSGVDLAGTFFGPGTAALHDDLPAQVGVFAVSLAALDVLERIHGLVPGAVAGYSLGTYAAFVAAGALDRRAALDVLLMARRLLEEDRRANAARPGGMGFVVGLTKAALEAEIGGMEVSIGNENAAQQFVLTGTRDAVEKAVEGLRPKALKAGVLPITLAMHSPRLEAACTRLRRTFDGKLGLRQPAIALYAPMLGRRVSSLEEVSSVLFFQLARPSLWAQTLGAMGTDGSSVFAEVGPGDVLTKLLRWTLRGAKGFVVEDPQSAEAFSRAMIAEEGVARG